MKMTIRIAMLAAALFCPTLAHAWPQCSGNWNQVPAGTSSAGGAIYTADGLTWQCQPKTTPPTPSTPGATSASTSNASSAANSSSNSASNSSSNATGGNSNSVATGGNQKQHQNQSQTATGGNATGGSASATGGSQTQSSTSSASNNGNGANNSTYSSTTNVAASKIPVATAIAPPSGSANTCFKGFGAGAQSPLFGASFGGGKIDENCAILEASRQAPSILARCKIFISDKYVKQAGVTLEDCLAQSEQPAPVVEVPAPTPAPVQTETTYVLPAPQVTINLPAPVLSTPAPVIVNPPAAKQRHARKPCDASTPASKPSVWDNERVENLPYTHKS